MEPNRGSPQHRKEYEANTMTDPMLPAPRKDLRQRYLDDEDLTLEEEREVLMSIRQGYAASTAAATRARTTRTVKSSGGTKDKAALQKLGLSILDMI